MKLAKFDTNPLRKFISFLINHIDDFITYYHFINLDSLPFYRLLSIKDCSRLINKEIYAYLKAIQENNIVEYINRSIQAIQENQVTWLTSVIDTSIISQLHFNRKLCLIHFIPDYTEKSKEAVSIIHEIEKIFSLEENVLMDVLNRKHKIDIETQLRDENKIGASLSKIRKILDHTPIHINLYDLDKDRSIFNNGAGKILFGHSPEQVMSQSFSKLWLSIVHPKDKDKVRARIENFKHLNEGDIDQLEYRMIDMNGKTLWYYSRATVFKTENNKVKQVLLNGLNINALKKAEEKKRYVESQLREAQRIAHIGSFDYDIVNDVIKYTEEAYRIYEFPKDKKKFKATDFQNLLDKHSLKKFQKNLKKVFKDKNYTNYEIQYRIILPNGNKKDLITRSKIIRGKNGTPIRMVGTVMDITSVKKVEYQLRKKNFEINNINRKLKESKDEINKINSLLEKKILDRTKALKASEEQYRFLAENVPQLFWTARPDGGLDFINKNVTKYTGAKPEQIYEWNWENYIHPDDLPDLMKEWKNSLKNGTTLLTEFRIKKKDKKYNWHLVKTVPLKEKNGNVIKWMGSATDIDEQKKFAEELKQKNKQLTIINQDLDNFIYTASHDLKAPISNIEGLLISLDDEITEYNGDVPIILNMMNTSVQQFKKTILDLTEITQAQKSRTETEKKNKLDEVLKEVESIVNDLIKTTHTKIKTDFKECDTIYFSRKNLKSILYNLISNAIKFRSSERYPEIFIKTQIVNNYVELYVKDNGRGFDENQKSKIFRMFKRLQSEEEGSGVGLYLVKRIITNAGGKIEASSKVGKGSIFRVYFPIKINNNSTSNHG